MHAGQDQHQHGEDQRQCDGNGWQFGTQDQSAECQECNKRSNGQPAFGPAGSGIRMVGLVSECLSGIIQALDDKLDGGDRGAKRHDGAERPDRHDKFALLAEILSRLIGLDCIRNQAVGDQCERGGAQGMKDRIIDGRGNRPVDQQELKKGIGPRQLFLAQGVGHLKKHNRDDGIADKFRHPWQGFRVEATRKYVRADQEHQAGDPQCADDIQQASKRAEGMRRRPALPPKVG